MDGNLNKEYWQKLSAESIIGKNAFPGAELFSQLPKGSSVLDLGCGNGEMSEFLSLKGYKVVGIDINEIAINQNKSKFSKVKYICGDITGFLPFENRTFDAVIISFVLVNIIPSSVREELISEITRILKTGGLIWVNEAIISDDYIQRYNLSKPFVEENYDFFVFKEGISSASIRTSEQMAEAIRENKIARIAHHFSFEDLKKLFNYYKLIFKKESDTSSPNTKSTIKMLILLFRRN
jgi:ubiquinone/menaquinone biosynthesis C-methylase UbiE